MFASHTGKNDPSILQAVTTDMKVELGLRCPAKKPQVDPILATENRSVAVTPQEAWSWDANEKKKDQASWGVNEKKTEMVWLGSL